MKKLSRSKVFLLVSVLFLSACTTRVVSPEEKVVPGDAEPYSGGTFEVDMTQSYISFLGRSNIINHEGKFEVFTAAIIPNAATPADLEKATFQATISVASVMTDNDGVTAHLKREDFFDAEQFPEATFVSTKVTSKGGDSYDITGDLTIKGVTKSVVLDAVVTDAYMTATYDLPRQDFGVGNDSYGNKLLDPLVPVDIKLVFKK